MAGSVKIPLHIKQEGRTQEDYARLAEHHAVMASINPSGFRQFPKRSKKQGAYSLAEYYATKAKMY